jgi:RNA polymerase sigma-70 factor (ECF subfamily)
MHVALDDFNELDDVIAPDEVYLMKELRLHIDEAISKLPTRCRQIFEMVRLQQMSYKKTAEILHLSPKTVENQLGIAMKKLLEDLKGYLEKIN